MFVWCLVCCAWYLCICGLAWWGCHHARDTHTPSSGERRRRAGAPSLAVKGLLQLGFQLFKVPFSRFIIHQNYSTLPAPTAARVSY